MVRDWMVGVTVSVEVVRVTEQGQVTACAPAAGRHRPLRREVRRG